MKKGEIFEEMRRRSLIKKKGDYIFISEKGAAAAIYETRRARIRNAFIVVCDEIGQEEWLIEQTRLKTCPKEVTICIKNIHEIAVHIGDDDDENTYHFLGGSETSEAETLSVIGVVELEEEVVAFSFDWKMKEINYLYLEKEFEEDSELYTLLLKMKRVGEMSNGTYQERTNRWQTETDFALFESGIE